MFSNKGYFPPFVFLLFLSFGILQTFNQSSRGVLVRMCTNSDLFIQSSSNHVKRFKNFIARHGYVRVRWSKHGSSSVLCRIELLQSAFLSTKKAATRMKNNQNRNRYSRRSGEISQPFVSKPWLPKRQRTDNNKLQFWATTPPSRPLPCWLVFVIKTRHFLPVSQTWKNII